MFIEINGKLYNTAHILSMDSNSDYFHILFHDNKKPETIKNIKFTIEELVEKINNEGKEKFILIYDTILKTKYAVNSYFIKTANMGISKTGVNRLYILDTTGENTGYSVDIEEGNSIVEDLKNST